MAGMTATAIDFDGFYQAHYGETVAMAYGYTADLAESQDIAQEAFSRAWQRWKVISHYEQPVSWVRRVATHLAHSRWRKLRVASLYLARQRHEDLPDLSPDHVDMVTALRTLPPAQRKAVVLHYLVDLPVAQIAEELGVADGTVKSWLHRGRNALAAELGDEVRRTVSPPPGAELRLNSEKRRRTRRAAASVAAAFLAVLLLVAGFQLLGRADGSPPLPPASPTPSPTDAAPSPTPVPRLAPAKLAPAFPASCTVQRLPYPSGDGVASYFSGGEPAGRLLLGSSAETNIYLWRDGKLDKRVVVADGVDDSMLYDINSSGTGVGSAYTEKGHFSYTYRNGELVRLQGGEGASPKAINENNVIVGSVENRPAIWRTPTSLPEFLSMPPGMDIAGLGDISEEGLMIGMATKHLGRGKTESHSYLWYPDGNYVELPNPPGMVPSDGGARFIRGEWVAGNVFGDGRFAAVLWNLRTGKMEVIPGVRAIDSLNEHGWIGYTAAEKITVRTPAGQEIVLPVVPGTIKDRSNSSVGLISDDGTLFAGQMLIGKEPDWEMVAVRWVCK